MNGTYIPPHLDFTKDGIIAQYEESLEAIAEALNDFIVAIEGEKAQWDAGDPTTGIKGGDYSISRDLLLRLSNAREEANSVRAWVDSQEAYRI
jgi:hypothetical protein